MTWKPPTDRTIRWLLDGDAAIRWQVLRDVVGARERTVERERRGKGTGHLLEAKVLIWRGWVPNSRQREGQREPRGSPYPQATDSQRRARKGASGSLCGAEGGGSDGAYEASARMG